MNEIMDKRISVGVTWPMRDQHRNVFSYLFVSHSECILSFGWRSITHRYKHGTHLTWRTTHRRTQTHTCIRNFVLQRRVMQSIVRPFGFLRKKKEKTNAAVAARKTTVNDRRRRRTTKKGGSFRVLFCCDKHFTLNERLSFYSI